jgi:D-glycero-D-manno-heptose 1,7-bisphosphate phosphatase
MANPARAVFLDRDGVINAAVVRDGKPYHPRTIQDFRVLPGVKEACELLHTAGFLLIVATYQPDVGRGQQDQAVVEAMHRIMCESLPIDRIEVCYDAGVCPGASSEFRKPRPGMLFRAAWALSIDLARSYLVGDRRRDIDCGRAAGCVTIFINRGYDEPLRMQPDYTAPDLLAAASIILSIKGDS